MSYSISTLLTRNLHDVFGENDPARPPAMTRSFTEDCVFYEPSGVHRGRTRESAPIPTALLILLELDEERDLNFRLYNKDCAKAILIYRRTLIKAGPRLSKGLSTKLFWESRLLGAIELAHKRSYHLDG